MESKHPTKSKLNALGVIVAIVAILDLLNDKVVPQSWLPYVMLASGVLTVVLRTFFTYTTLDTPLAKKDTAESNESEDKQKASF